MRLSPEQLAEVWRVELRESFETPSSVIVYGRRDGQAVVLKVVREPNDEWHAGEVLAAFGDRGVVRVLEHVEGAMLLERLDPGTPLFDIVHAGRDDDATAILADVMAAMSPGVPPSRSPHVADWARGFARYRATADAQVPGHLVERAEQLFVQLCASQRNPRLLHGDLHHHNVLLDGSRGWVAIDPKGVVGELEYEIGAAMRNPGERPDLFTHPRTIERRLDRFVSALHLDTQRVIAWCFSQAVLSAIWGIEDGGRVADDDVALRLAAVLEPMTR